MVKHIVCWNYQDKLTQEERDEAKAVFKGEIAHLAEVIPGIESLKVRFLSDEDGLFDSSNMEIMLEGVYVSKEALEGYIIHPDHVKTGAFVREHFCDRACVDFKV